MSHSTYRETGEGPLESRTRLSAKTLMSSHPPSVVAPSTPPQQTRRSVLGNLYPPDAPTPDRLSPIGAPTYLSDKAAALVSPKRPKSATSPEAGLRRSQSIAPHLKHQLTAKELAKMGLTDSRDKDIKQLGSYKRAPGTSPGRRTGSGRVIPDENVFGPSTTRKISQGRKVSGEVIIPGITQGAEEISGTHGRIRLNLEPTSDNPADTPVDLALLRNPRYMDSKRHNLHSYEYLCHVGEAKEWLERTLGETLPTSVSQFEDHLRDGITLARIAQKFNPQSITKIFKSPHLQFRHTDNIIQFLNWIRDRELVGLEECYQFETVDLYNKRNIPSVIYCIHALSHFLANRGQAQKMKNLVGKLDFTEKEVNEAQRQLDQAGIVLPNFNNIQVTADAPVEPSPLKIPEFPNPPKETSIDVPNVASVQPLGPEEQDLPASIPSSKSAYFERRDSVASDADAQARQREIDRIIADARKQRLRRSQIFDQSHLALEKEKDELRRLEAEQVRLLRLQEDRLREDSALRASEHQRKQFELEERQRRDAEHRKNEEARLASERQKVAHEKEEYERRKGALADEERRLEAERQKEREALENFKRAQEKALEEEKKRLKERHDHDLQQRRQEMERQKAQDDRERLLLSVEVQESSARLQAMWRAGMARKKIALERSRIHSAFNTLAVSKIQALAKRALARRPIHEKLIALMPAIEAVEEVQSWARYFLERKRISEQQSMLDQCEGGIVALQARVRGALQRHELYAAIYNTANLEPVAIRMQAVLRGVLVRRSWAQRERRWRANIDVIVKTQNLMRTRIEKIQYEQLTKGKIVPLNAVKTFLHLLGQSDLDFQEEVELEERRRAVVQLVRELHALEADRSELDMKIALFVKHKISADDMSKMRRTQGMRLVNFLTDNGDVFSGHDKQSRDKRELYGQLFYLCQTRPQYLARLFAILDSLPSELRTDKDLKVIEAITMALFGYAQKAREEYYLLALLGRSIEEELRAVRKVDDSLGADFIFIKLASQYLKDVRYRNYLEGTVSPRINEILRNADLDLEISPSEIYKGIWRDEYKRTGKKPTRSETVHDAEAARMPDTRTIYIQHLQQLRSFTQGFLDVMRKTVHRMPFGVRYLARRFHEALCAAFPATESYRLKQTTAAFVYLRFFHCSLAQPETLQEVDIEALEQRGRRKNMVQICYLLQQVVMGAHPDDGCLHPLHEWIRSAAHEVVQWIEHVIDIPSLDQYFHADEYADLASASRPIVYISPPEIFRLHSLLLTHRTTICKAESGEGPDVMLEILRNLGGVENPEPEDVDLGARKREVALVLSTQAVTIEDYEAEYRTEMAELKRYAVAVLKVQTGRDLVDIMVQEVTERDEEIWQHVLAAEEASAEKSRKISGAVLSQFADLKDALFADVKIAFFELLLGFEERGIFTRTNVYQDLVNAIAMDIRNSHRKRNQRTAELEQMSQRLEILKKKREYLESQIKSYHTYIDNALVGTQKNRKKRLALPFTAQFFHERDLARQGKVPKFGSYKYSVAKLAERDILISMDPYQKSNYADLTITLSSDDVGQFTLEAFYKGGLVPRGTERYDIQGLLEMQYDGKTTISMFGCQAKMNLSNLLLLISKKFYV